MDDPALVNLESRAEFERQQFALHDTRRLAAETHANAVSAAALAVRLSRSPWKLVAAAGV